MGFWNNTSSPTKVTWANPEVVPEGKRQNGGWYFNPSSGYVEQWWSGDGGGIEQSTSSTSDGQAYLDQIKSTLEGIVSKQYGAESSSADYLTKNPFKYDEVWAKVTKDFQGTLKEEVNADPYYKEKLSNYLEDVETVKTQAQEDTDTLLKELDRQEKVYKQQDATSFQQAREKALEGLSGAGMLDTGAGMREKNVGDISHEVGLQSYMDTQDLKKQQAQTAQSRLLSKLQTESGRFEKDLEREKALQVETQLQKKMQENINYWKAGFEKATGNVAQDYMLYA